MSADTTAKPSQQWEWRPVEESPAKPPWLLTAIDSVLSWLGRGVVYVVTGAAKGIGRGVKVSAKRWPEASAKAWTLVYTTAWCAIGVPVWAGWTWTTVLLAAVNPVAAAGGVAWWANSRRPEPAEDADPHVSILRSHFTGTLPPEALRDVT